ncbi:MAG: transposase [Candidatus Woesearchaeota archaeon]
MGKRFFFVFETVGVDEDHVHILVQAAPRYSPSRVMQIVKSISAWELFKVFPEIKEELWGVEYLVKRVKFKYSHIFPHNINNYTWRLKW